MITVSFIWLIASHIAVFLPIIIGYKVNKRKWLASSIILFFTAFFSSIYHWSDQNNFDKDNFEIVGTGYDVHSSLDFFSSYLSIFLIAFYSINPRKKPEHIDIALMIIVIICHFITLVDIEWYSFLLIIIIYIFIYSLFCKETDWTLVFKNLVKSWKSFWMSVVFFSIAMFMQYYLCYNIYGRGELYHIYHGIWHTCMFISAAFCIYWNSQMEKKDN